MMIRTCAAMMLLTATAAHAVPYTLPSTAERPYAQLQPADGSALLCATWVRGGECDVAPGTYRLVTYGTDWSGESRNVTIGQPGSGPVLTRASSVCDEADEGTIVTTDDQSTARCAASCPLGTVPIATSCDVADGATFQPNLISASGGQCLWGNPESQIYLAGVTCASADLFE